MRPATLRVPKLLLPVGGRPFADWQLSWMRDSGVSNALYCIGHLGDQIRAFIGDGSRWGLKVSYSEDGDELIGTAGALRLAAEREMLEDVFAVTYGDSFLQVSVADALEAFRGHPQADALMVVYENRGRYDRSNVVLDGGFVREYVPNAVSTTLVPRYIDYGLSVMTTTVVDQFPRHSPLGLPEIFVGLATAGRLAALEAADRFFEIGSPRGLGDLEQWLRVSGQIERKASS